MIEDAAQGGVSAPSTPYFTIKGGVTLPCLPGLGRSTPAAGVPPVRDEGPVPRPHASPGSSFGMETLRGTVPLQSGRCGR